MWWLAGAARREPAPRPLPTPAESGGPSADLPPGGGPPPSASSGLGAPPVSLTGKEVDGELRVDAEGRFLPSPEALQLFDYFLSARGEEPIETIRARIGAEIDRRLPAGATADARDLLDRYLRYLEAGSELDTPGIGADDMEEHLQRLRELRREIFGAAVARALFEEEEQVARVAVERRRILDDPNLSDRERIARLAELQQQLPEEVRLAEEEALLPHRLTLEEDRLRAQGASDEEIRALRERMLGETQDERLEELDRERASWDRRMEAYRADRDEALAEIPSANEATKYRFVRSVRERHFAPEEIPRVEALDRLEAQRKAEERSSPPEAPGPAPTSGPPVSP